MRKASVLLQLGLKPLADSNRQMASWTIDSDHISCSIDRRSATHRTREVGVDALYPRRESG